MQRITLPALALGASLALLTGSAVAQVPDCFTNPVPNGGFEALFPSPWVFSGGSTAAFPVMRNVRGDGDSNAFQVDSTSNPFTITQNTPFPLSAGQDYRFRVDTLRSTQSLNFSVDLIDSTGNRQQILSQLIPTFGTNARMRIAGNFQVPTSGMFTIELQGDRAVGGMFFDNVAIVEDGGPKVFFTSTRLRPGTNQVRLEGQPSAFTALLFSVGVGPAFPIPGFGPIPLQLNPALIITAVNPVFIEPSGEVLRSFDIPPATAGCLVAFQPIDLSALNFGCPVQIVF